MLSRGLASIKGWPLMVLQQRAPTPVTSPPPVPSILGGPTDTPHATRAAISSFIQSVPTPSTIAETAQASTEKKGLSSGEVGAILACVVFVVIGSLAALHFFLSRKRRAARDESSDTDSELERERFRAQRRRRRDMREHARVGVEVDWDERARWEAWEREQERRRAPRPHEVKMRERLVPVYSHVRHVRKPPPGYFRGYRPAMT